MTLEPAPQDTKRSFDEYAQGQELIQEPKRRFGGSNDEMMIPAQYVHFFFTYA